MTEPLFEAVKVFRKCGHVRPPGRVQCLPCRAKRNREGRYANPEMVRAENLRRMYGITLADYEAMRVAQDYRCAVCGKHEDEIQPPRGPGRPRKDGSPPAPPPKLAVDHCHRTGKVRGLLCDHCNRALGSFQDDPAAMRAGADYIERFLALEGE